MRAVTYFAMAAGLASSMAAAAKITDFTVDPESVELRDRGSWCMGERNTCTILCDKNPKENKCDMATLEYSCTCTNGTEPGLKYYDSSLYSFVCQEAFKQCTVQNAGTPDLLTCEDEIQAKCGTLDVTKFKGSSDDSSDSTGDDEDTSDDSSDDEGSSDEASDGAEEGDKGDDKSGSARSGLVGTGAAVVALGVLAAFL